MIPETPSSFTVLIKNASCHLILTLQNVESTDVVVPGLLTVYVVLLVFIYAQLGYRGFGTHFTASCFFLV